MAHYGGMKRHTTGRACPAPTPALVRLFLSACLLGLLGLAGCTTLPVTYPAADTLLPDISPDMNTPGYWISRLDDPDRLLLDAAGIARYNQESRDKGLVVDLATWTPPDGATLRQELSGTATWLAKQELFCPDGRRVHPGFLDPLVERMNLAILEPTLVPRPAFTASRTDLRVLPTRDGLFDGAFDYFIDNLQASSLDPGEPCLVLHQSSDAQWCYVRTRFAAGWITVTALALTDQPAFQARLATDRFLVVTAAKADLYADPALTRHRLYVRMGTCLVAAPQASQAQVSPDSPPGAVPVLLPGRDAQGRLVEETCWVDPADVHPGYLPATRRTAIKQAFKTLNAPYGWGGMFGEQDCSQYLQQIFATMGLCLPRNSAAQAKTGVPIAGFAKDTPEAGKLALLEQAGIPGFTVMRLPGHIMLFLGVQNGKGHAIHATWGYRQPAKPAEFIRLINRVTVSTLDLGAGSSRGSLLQRLTTATAIQPQPPAPAPAPAETGLQ